jgi:hypothetical protein
MKKALTMILAISIVLLMSGVAIAAVSGFDTEDDWNPAGPTYRTPGLTDGTNTDSRGASDGLWDSGENSPHAGYLSSTNKCEVCHSPHQAGVFGDTDYTSYKLLYGSTDAAAGATDACSYCHVSGSLGIIDVYNPSGAYTIRGGHEMESTTDIPDSMWGVGAETFDCSDCHSVHSANALDFGPSPGNYEYILKTNPSWGTSQAPTASTATTDSAKSKTGFCAACHDMNDDFDYNLDSHVMTDPVSPQVADAAANSEYCYGCHAAPRVSGSADAMPSWPHDSDSIVLLGAQSSSTTTMTDQTDMDDHCLSCHSQVGTDY